MIKVPFLRGKTSTSVVLFSAAFLMLLSSPLLPLFDVLQPVQAQTATPMTFRTTEPAITEDPKTGLKYTLTFDAQGTFSNSSGYQRMSGTFQISSQQDGQILTSGRITNGQFSNSSSGASITMSGLVIKGQDTYYYTIITDCSSSNDNKIIVEVEGGPRPEYSGPVECSIRGGDSTTQQQSSSTSSYVPGSSQDRESRDGDSDGIPDSSDRCTHNSNPRCFKEDTTTQQQSSSTSMAGNQTR